LLGVLVVSLASLAWAGIPDLDDSGATMDGSANGASLFCLPNALGYDFTQARTLTGTVDATISLVLVDGLGDFIEGYPTEDMWLETSGGGLVACPAGTIADGPTDEMGATEWQDPLFAGGNSFGETVTVMIAGSPLNQAGLQLTFNSADITGDLVVNLADISLFATDYFNAYNYQSDFAYDGVLNLADITLMATGNGTACPQ
jgi:hypothetical protein